MIQPRDVHIYRRVLTSAPLQGVLTAEQSNDPQAMATACRFLFLILPMILRSPAKFVPQRLDAFLAGDLKLCARGLISIQDNYYVSRVNRAPCPRNTKRQPHASSMASSPKPYRHYSARKPTQHMVVKHPPTLAGGQYANPGTSKDSAIPINKY